MLPKDVRVPLDFLKKLGASENPPKRCTFTIIACSRPIIPGRSPSNFSPTSQTSRAPSAKRNAVRCSASRVKGALRPTGEPLVRRCRRLPCAYCPAYLMTASHDLDLFFSGVATSRDSDGYSFRPYAPGRHLRPCSSITT